MTGRKTEPVLYLVIPCYNEEAVLPVTKEIFVNELQKLIGKRKISSQSRILYVDDGSRDRTWEILRDMSRSDSRILAIRQSRNRGHQNALLAGLMEAKDLCDITISMDCDGQDDVEAVEPMVDAFLDGCEIVYGVRSSRETDSVFKRVTAQGFYRVLSWMGAEVIYNHADYRLMSARALEELAKFKEVNLYLRGIVPMVGFKSTTVEYSRKKRIEGKTHYPLKKMLSLAFNGITSLSVRPLKMIAGLGVVLAAISMIGIVWAVISALAGNTVAGWASLVCIVCFLSGIQLLCLGVIGEYIGKIYLETKERPRYIISERTYEQEPQRCGFPEMRKVNENKELEEESSEYLKESCSAGNVERPERG